MSSGTLEMRSMTVLGLATFERQKEEPYDNYEAKIIMRS